MNMSDLKSGWERGKKWVDGYTRTFPQLETLADGVAISNQKDSPNLGSPTVANAVRQIPRGSVQQLPVLSAQVNGTKLSVDAIVCSYLLRAVVFNPDTFGNGILSTMQMAAQIALTDGFVALRANVGKVFNQFSTMLETIHWNDFAIEPGVFDASNSQDHYVRTRVTEAALDALIENAAANPKTLWNLGALERLKAAGPQAIVGNQYMSMARQNSGTGDVEQYDFVTRYGVGPYYDIDVFSPQLTDSDDDKLMTIKSKSKFGFPRLSLLVIDPAQMSPFGTSRVKLASPMGNYGNIYLQSTGKMQLLNADPPSFKRGIFTTATPLRRGAQYESVDPNADFRLIELSNSTLEQFTNVMSYVDGNILSTMGVTGVGPQSANAGVYQNTEQTQAINAVTTLSSQQVTSIIENAIRQYGLTALDLYLSEQIGDSALIVDDEAKNAINELFPPEPIVDPATGMQSMSPPFVGDDNVVKVDWKALYDRIQTLSVTVELSITPDQMKDQKRKELQDAVTVASQTTDPNDPMAVAQKNTLTKELVSDLAPEATARQQNQPQTQMPTNIPAVGGEPAPVQ